jgi:hypothetical protein
MDTLEIVQLYETTLKAREPDFAMHFLAVPARCIAKEHQERLANPKLFWRSLLDCRRRKISPLLVSRRHSWRCWKPMMPNKRGIG